MPRLAKDSRTRLICVCASTGKSARQAADRFDFESATTDIDEVLSQSSVDVVFIATRHDSHAALTAAALRAGKHVYVEKPLCISEMQLERIEQELIDARTNGYEPCLMVGFNRRFSVACAHAAEDVSESPEADRTDLSGKRRTAPRFELDPATQRGWQAASSRKRVTSWISVIR